MTFGPATLLALLAALLATLVWLAVPRLGGPPWLAQFLSYLVLAFVVIAGQIIRLP